MSEVHVVEQGDTMIRIAQRYGFRSWEAIYMHEANAALREECPDPGALLPGVEVTIPDKTPQEFTCAVNERHSFTVRALQAHLRLVVEDEQGEPLAGVKYKLVVGDATHEGTTTDDALLEVDVDPDPTRGELTVWNGDQVLTWTLELGHLDPLGTTSGVQARLANLGFKVDVTGDEDDATRRALRNFQQLHGLDPSGDLDAATRAKIGELHDGSEA